MFSVNQKVVCVDDSNQTIRRDITKGRVYTVRWVGELDPHYVQLATLLRWPLRRPPGVCVRLMGIERLLAVQPGAPELPPAVARFLAPILGYDVPLAASRFRPLAENETGQSTEAGVDLLKTLLDPANHVELEDA